MKPRQTPVTAGERRGLIALAILALIVAGATLAVKTIHESAVEAEPALPSAEVVGNLPDSVANPQKSVSKRSAKKAKKKTAAQKRVRQQPDERDFLNERNDRKEE